jgi:hypothetical protein
MGCADIPVSRLVRSCNELDKETRYSWLSCCNVAVVPEEDEMEFPGEAA